MQNGSRPLLRYFGDSTRGAGNFGTDGKDMVWTYAEGATACDHESDKREVWTAPYTTDPAQLQATARRLRSDVRGMNAWNYAVGFGYAARAVSLPAPAYNGLFLVRLSDGTAWLIPGSSNIDALSWGDALGFTSEELFALVSMHYAQGAGGATILRVRLDSLGQGTPAD